MRHTFFDPRDMWQSFVGDPKKGYYSVGEAIWLNIRMFLAAEVLILLLARVSDDHGLLRPAARGRG